MIPVLLAAILGCVPELTALFTPPRPQLGRYEVCTTPQRIEEAAPSGWAVEAADVIEAFGASGPYDRAALARLFGGRRPSVARGWIDHPDRFESLTYISPYPDPSLTRLIEGTMIVRWTLGPTAPSAAF